MKANKAQNVYSDKHRIKKHNVNTANTVSASQLRIGISDSIPKLEAIKKNNGYATANPNKQPTPPTFADCE